ncbi:MAG: GTP 3',8-cyclase MoaA [Acidimicrobiia bacterium]|nr:MAG: GTP 3',8-cyclase MoaA [Acidimicrobiia bacterium]
MPTLDTLGRPVRDLRISVTDRCNFRCRYCMPREVFDQEWVYLRHTELLTFEEITRITRLAVELGVEKVRLTGGEPLLRKDVHLLIGMLSGVDGMTDLAMTTNASVLARRAEALRDAGLQRITVSLDSIDDEVFRAMNDVDFPVERVLEGIDVAASLGLGPVKVNAVVQRGVNDHTIEDLAGHFRGTGHTVRYIEYMDVGMSNGWKLDDVVSAAEIVERINDRWPLEAVPPSYPGEVATRFRYLDGEGEIGVIGSVTQPFCGNCTRLRLSAEGQLYTCLFAGTGTDLKGPIRTGASDDDLRGILEGVWTKRSDRYSERRSEHTPGWERVEMSYIGG